MADGDPQTGRRSGTARFPTGARTGTVLVRDLGRSPDEFLVDRQGQVIDPAFVVPDQSGSIEAGVPEAELIRGRHDAEDPNSGSG